MMHSREIDTGGAERRDLDGALEEAQRLAAIGRLVTSVAHDFNNLLVVITTSTGLARASLAEGAPAWEDLDAIDQAAARAVELTRQLMAFGRKPVRRRDAVDVNSVVAGLRPLLRRVIHENVAIRTVTVPGASGVLASAGQLEQVLMNLALNARDAMATGGTLTIETGDVRLTAPDLARHGTAAPPGLYARIRVCDTGVGMDDTTRRRVFEPFFTTKAPSDGTGLGLATVAGIVDQLGGFVWITSAPGRGTVVDVHLPRAAVRAVAEERSQNGSKPGPDAAARRSGVVLLVEDDPAVRGVLRRILARDGFTVIEATNGREALRIADERPGAIDLVLADVVMPELGGHTFAAELARSQPELPVLFVSGYPQESVARHAAHGPPRRFLQKPFTHEHLVAAVRDLLDGAPRDASR